MISNLKANNLLRFMLMFYSIKYQPELFLEYFWLIWCLAYSSKSHDRHFLLKVIEMVIFFTHAKQTVSDFFWLK